MFLLQFGSLDLNMSWRWPILLRRYAVWAVGCAVRNWPQRGHSRSWKAGLNCYFSFVPWGALCLSGAIEAFDKGPILTYSLHALICGCNLKLDRLKAGWKLPKRFLNHQISKRWRLGNWRSSTMWPPWQHISLIRISLCIQAEFHKLSPELIILQMQLLHFIRRLLAGPLRLQLWRLPLFRRFRWWMLRILFSVSFSARKQSLSWSLHLPRRGTCTKTWFSSKSISIACYSSIAINRSARRLTLTLVDGLRRIRSCNHFEGHFRRDSSFSATTISSPDGGTWCLLLMVLPQ